MSWYVIIFLLLNSFILKQTNHIVTDITHDSNKPHLCVGFQCILSKVGLFCFDLAYLIHSSLLVYGTIILTKETLFYTKKNVLISTTWFIIVLSLFICCYILLLFKYEKAVALLILLHLLLYCGFKKAFYVFKKVIFIKIYYSIAELQKFAKCHTLDKKWEMAKARKDVSDSIRTIVNIRAVTMQFSRQILLCTICRTAAVMNNLSLVKDESLQQSLGYFYYVIICSYLYAVAMVIVALTMLVIVDKESKIRDNMFGFCCIKIEERIKEEFYLYFQMHQGQVVPATEGNVCHNVILHELEQASNYSTCVDNIYCDSESCGQCLCCVYWEIADLFCCGMQERIQC